MNNYTKELAKFCSGLDFDAIPRRIVEKTKFMVVDNLANIFGAATLEFGSTMADYARSLQDHEEATALGSGFRTSARTAAFVNGSLAETLEMQCGYTKGGYHPGDATISAPLAVAEWKKKGGKALLTAIVAGYEVGNRISEAIHPTHLSRGFQPAGTVGTLGAAAAVARLLDLNAEQTKQALAIAGFLLPICTGDNRIYSVKPVHGGAAAKSGIEAVLLAQHGLKGAPLEGDTQIRKGFCRIVTDEPPRFEKMTEGLGEKYTIDEVYFKPYATCRINQGPTEMALNIKINNNLKYEEIDNVLIKTYAYASKRTGSMRTNLTSAFTLCQFSMSYAVAGALMFGEAGLSMLTEERIRDPRIHQFASKITIVADPDLEKLYPANRPATMEITMKDGRKFHDNIRYAKGDYRNPMTETELGQKFLDLANPALGEEKAKKALEMILHLEKLDSVQTLIGYLKKIEKKT
jgi:2-methylcitrate dehydratase PrpD